MDDFYKFIGKVAIGFIVAVFLWIAGKYVFDHVNLSWNYSEQQSTTDSSAYTENSEFVEDTSAEYNVSESGGEVESESQTLTQEDPECNTSGSEVEHSEG